MAETEQNQVNDIWDSYRIKPNAIDSVQSSNPSGIRSRLRDFVKEQGGLEVVAGGNYIENEPTLLDIYHFHGCTIKVSGEWLTDWNYDTRFKICVYGKKENIQKISEELDKALDITRRR